jgi:hypothetical protein
MRRARCFLVFALEGTRALTMPHPCDVLQTNFGQRVDLKLGPKAGQKIFLLLRIAETAETKRLIARTLEGSWLKPGVNGESQQTPDEKFDSAWRLRNIGMRHTLSEKN